MSFDQISLKMKEKSLWRVVLSTLVEFFVSLVFIGTIGSLSFLTSFSFTFFTHRDHPNTTNITDLEHHIKDSGVQFGALGVTTQTFIFVLVGRELKSWLYTVYIWIFRRAKFPLGQYGLWVPILVSEIICVLAQNALIFFISPFVSDAGIGYFCEYQLLLTTAKNF